MKQHKSCQPEIVAQSRCCHVTRCADCETFHLHIGPVSLRLKAEAFEDICETLLSFYRRESDSVQHYEPACHNH